eukprot:7190742-Prymnesium_polylepis.1
MWRSDNSAERTRAFDQELRNRRAQADQDRADQDAAMTLLLKGLANLTTEEREDIIIEAETFAVYSHVAFKGLKARPDLNGKRGKVASFDATSRRFVVHLERHIDQGGGNFYSLYDGEQVRVKVANLVRSARMPAFLGIAAGDTQGRSDVRVVIEWLDTCGGDIEARHPVHNDTILMLASCTSDTSLVAELLRRGADVGATARSS